jgi:hypothetical protein
MEDVNMMTGERWYVALKDDSGLTVIGWNLNHEPTEDNECGYPIEAGPFATEEEARLYVGSEE